MPIRFAGLLSDCSSCGLIASSANKGGSCTSCLKAGIQGHNTARYHNSCAPTSNLFTPRIFLQETEKLFSMPQYDLIVGELCDITVLGAEKFRHWPSYHGISSGDCRNVQILIDKYLSVARGSIQSLNPCSVPLCLCHFDVPSIIIRDFYLKTYFLEIARFGF
ncbi:unnamed protein product [Protopolystoma xenopodis]|uniref:Uncharacterized protein n=1 Tax=Protopolystoma xenopodis TaxID=117903 RepID=A0A448X883_9PLAT|nr:unnamed protein product [Protopolystoma xenopodis]